jgi:hypothetical protein
MYLPYEIKEKILDEVIKLEDKNGIFAVSLWHRLLPKRVLDIYRVDYRDSTNFIYIMNNVRQNWYRKDPYDENSEYDYYGLLSLYLKNYDEKGISIIYNHYSKLNGYVVYMEHKQRCMAIDHCININRMRYVRSEINRYTDGNKPDDRDYNLQMTIRKLKKEWDNIRHYYSKKELLSSPPLVKRKLDNAYKALCFLEYNYDINSNREVRTRWIKKMIKNFMWKKDDREYNVDVAEMCKITSMPLYPKLEILMCNDQAFKTLPPFPKLKTLYCDGVMLDEFPFLINLEYLSIKNIEKEILNQDIILKKLPNIKKIKQSPNNNRIPSHLRQ